MDNDFDEDAGWDDEQDKDFDEHRQRIDDLESRIDELESSSRRGEAGIATGYGMGMTLAMILSWSRNASILWCMLHGILSWIYVIYFALTRS